MILKINKAIDRLSEFFANRKGLFPFLGLVLIVINLVLQLLPYSGWLISSNLLLHLGLILAIIGFMLAWAL